MDEITNINNKLSLGNFYFDKTGLTVTGSPTFEEWQNCGDFLRQAEKSVQFWIGDWLNYGEKKYGETYSQALEITDYEYDTLRKTKYVSNQIEIGRRRPNLSFSHHQEVAPLSPYEQDKWLDRAENEGLTRNELRQEIRGSKLVEIELPAGKYSVIYADPPWQYENSGFNQSAESQYPTMSLEQICNLKINELAGEPCVLFLWATSPLLPGAFDVMEAWGFEYKASMVWVKDKAPGIGWWINTKHEHLLIGTYGGNAHPLIKLDSVFYDGVKEHSQKPECVYVDIEKMYNGRKIELFARNKRANWDSWGNQL